MHATKYKELEMTFSLKLNFHNNPVKLNISKRMVMLRNSTYHCWQKDPVSLPEAFLGKETAI